MGQVLVLASTDPLTGDVAGGVGAVMVTWFGGRLLEKIAQLTFGPLQNSTVRTLMELRA